MLDSRHIILTLVYIGLGCALLGGVIGYCLAQIKLDGM